MDEVRGMLRPSELPTYYWLVQTGTAGRFILPSQEEFEKWCTEHKDLVDEDGTHFALWRSEDFDKIQQEIWLYQGTRTGVLDVADLKDDVDFKKRNVPETQRREYGNSQPIVTRAHDEWDAMIAWQGYEEERKGQYSFEKSTYEHVFDFRADSAESLRKEISRFITRKELEGVRMLAYSKDIPTKTLEFFAFPEKSRNFSEWYGDHEDLLQDWKCGELVEWRSVSTWKPTLEYLQPQLKELTSEISRLTAKKRRLEGLIEDREEEVAPDSSENQSKAQRVV